MKRKQPAKVRVVKHKAFIAMRGGMPMRHRVSAKSSAVWRKLRELYGWTKAELVADGWSVVPCTILVTIKEPRP